MERMPILRLILAGLVSIGLVLSPVVAANVMAAMSVTAMDGVGPVTTTSSPDKPCPCCDMASKCVAATCTVSCSQIGFASDLSYPVALIGHAVLSGIVPLMHQGFAKRPATPPPRA